MNIIQMQEALAKAKIPGTTASMDFANLHDGHSFETGGNFRGSYNHERKIIFYKVTSLIENKIYDLPAYQVN